VFRRLVLGLGVAALMGAASAPGASADVPVPANCGNFAATLAAAVPGETIVLTGLCTGQSNALPAAASNLTIQGAATGVNGFDGLDTTTTPALTSTGSATNGVTLRNLVFENYGSVAVQIGTNTVGNPYLIDHVTFSNDHGTALQGGGGLFLNVFGFSACPTPGPSISISNSTFTSNSTAGSGPGVSGAEGGGGGAHIGLDCSTGGGTPVVNVTGSTFAGNVVNGPATAPRQGGGLWVGSTLGSSTAKPLALTQSGNLFSGNSVTGSGATFAGGGEFTAGANLNSTADRFLANSLPGPSSSTVHSEGGGLSTRSGGSCTAALGVISTATNLVAAANTISAPSGTGTGGEGAGIYAGCVVGVGGYDLTLTNSSVSGNQATGTGAVAGVDGEATDLLHLRNTILFGNPGGADLDGFGASPGASVTAADSDVCAIGAGTPFAGAGNICADPLLVNAGAGDAHETSGSPTIDAGSNSFVGSTTTDVFGNPRVVPGRLGDAAIVDMGAAEFQLPPVPPNPEPPSNSFTLGKLKGKTLFVDVVSPGTVDVIQAGAGGSAAAAAAKKLLNTSSASGGPGTIAVALRLTKRAKQRLKTKGKVKLSASVTFTPAGGTANSEPAKLKIRKKTKK